MRRRAAEMRFLPDDDLEKKVKVRTLGDFKQETVLLLLSVRCLGTLQDRESTTGYVATYEGIPDKSGRKDRGKVYIPAKVAEQLDEAKCVVYMGLKKSKAGREYQDVRMISARDKRKKKKQPTRATMPTRTL